MTYHRLSGLRVRICQVLLKWGSPSNVPGTSPRSCSWLFSLLLRPNCIGNFHIVIPAWTSLDMLWLLEGVSGLTCRLIYVSYADGARSASGIGSACCKALAKAGARGILIADINLPAAERMATELKTAATNPEFQALAVHLDVTVEESVKSTVAYISQSFGRVDYCIHCAAVSLSCASRIFGQNYSFNNFSLA